MRQVTQTIYRYDELSSKAKRRAREKEAETIREMWDGDAVLDDAKRIAPMLGITLSEKPRGGISFSGFGSQGDGASFTGKWEANSLADCAAVVRNYAPMDKELHAIADRIQRIARATPTLWADIMRPPAGHHYSHEHTVQIALLDGDDVAPDAVLTDLAGALRAFMRWIYRQLETDYDAATTTAAVEEYITDDSINGMEFLITGERWIADEQPPADREKAIAIEAVNEVLAEDAEREKAELERLRDFALKVRAIMVTEDNYWRDNLSGADVIQDLSMFLESHDLGAENGDESERDDDIATDPPQ